MDYSDSSEDEFSDIGSGSDVESEEEEVESEVNVSSASSGNEGENDEEMEVDDEEEANEEILRSKNGMEWSIDPPHFRNPGLQGTLLHSLPRLYGCCRRRRRRINA